MVSFATTKGFGGRNGLQPASAWFQVAKWQALAAKAVAGETGAGSIWSWGWAEWNAAEADPAKPLAACAWLWARSPDLCDAPATIGASFGTSLTAGQIDLPAGVQCSVGGQTIPAVAIKRLQVLTGDRETAFSALFERAVESSLATVPTADVLAAEAGIVADVVPRQPPRVSRGARAGACDPAGRAGRDRRRAPRAASSRPASARRRRRRPR